MIESQFQNCEWKNLKKNRLHHPALSKSLLDVISPSRLRFRFCVINCEKEVHEKETILSKDAVDLCGSIQERQIGSQISTIRVFYSIEQKWPYFKAADCSSIYFLAVTIYPQWIQWALPSKNYYCRKEQIYMLGVCFFSEKP